MMAKNYYELLGVSSSANDSEIKKAFKDLSLKTHPDKSKDRTVEGLAVATAKFQEINEAKDVLLDPEKRKAHDLALKPKEPVVVQGTVIVKGTVVVQGTVVPPPQRPINSDAQKPTSKSGLDQMAEQMKSGLKGVCSFAMSGAPSTKGIKKTISSALKMLQSPTNTSGKQASEEDKTTMNALHKK